MEMTVISSTLSALLSKTICGVYRGRHKQTVFLIFLSRAVRLQGCLPAREEDSSRPAEKWKDRIRERGEGGEPECMEGGEREIKQKGETERRKGEREREEK